MNEGWLLDSTYIMPFFGINVKIPNLNNDLAKILTEKSGKIYITTCSLIEAKWKSIRNFLKTGNISYLNRVNKVLESFQYNKYIKILNPWFVKDASNWADQLLIKGHQDYMDCWIAGTAMAKNLIFVSEDEPLIQLIKNLNTWKSLICINWQKFIESVL